MSRTFWLVSPGGKWTVSPPIPVRQQFRADAIEVVMFSVGEGEAILISRNSRFVLMDGGSGPRKPTNDELGGLLAGRIPVGGLRAIIASHPHQDHTNAHRVFGTTFSDRARPNAEYFDNAIGRSTQWFNDRLGGMPGFTRQAIDNTHATDNVAWMPELGATIPQLRSNTSAQTEPPKNYWSVFTVLVFNQAVFLFTGDAHKGYEASLVSRLQQLVDRVHVLKVTHHGSSSGTSPKLIQAFPPAIAFASTDEHETHCLEPDVRRRLGGAAIYTTHHPDREVQPEQDIIIRTDGQQRTVTGTQGVMFEVWRRKPALRPLESAQ